MKLASRRMLAVAAVISALLAGPYSTIGAATVEDLYTVVIEQNPQARDPRRDAIQRAMAQVLVRVTGSNAAASAPELQAIIRNAENAYLNSYAFLQAQEVRVGFIARNLDEALTGLGWPVWGPERPSTMFWIAIDWSTVERALVSSGEFDTGYEHSPEMQELIDLLRDEIAERAEARAVPYSLPGFDLTDMVAVDFADVWNFSTENLLAASARYGADANVVGRLRDDGFGLEAEWTLIIGEEFQPLPVAGAGEVVDRLADRYASEFSVGGGLRTLELRISGVRDLSDYGIVLSYLDTLSILERIDVSSYQDGLLTLQVSSRGDGSVLSRVLGLNDVLRRAPERTGSGFFGDSLEFELAAGIRAQ